MSKLNDAASSTSAAASGAREKSSEKKQNAILQLLQFAGSRKKLAYLGSFLAALNGILTILPLVFVWFVLRDLIQAIPAQGEAGSTETAIQATADSWIESASAVGADFWAWAAFIAAIVGILVYFCALMCTHLSAFRIAANMRKQCLAHIAKVPLGYLDANASGKLRRIIDGCAGQTEDVIAHKMPDFIASLTAPVAFLVTMFVFDWVMGLVCLIPVAISLFAMWWMMGRDLPQGGRYFMQQYQEALAKMSQAATEYVRGIPVVKVFQQTVHSFRAFHNAVVEYRDMATQYVNFCKLPQVIQLVAINSTFAVLVPAGIILANTTGNFAAFLVDFIFYVIFSALTTTMMNKIMYSSEAVMMAEDSMRRVKEILDTPIMGEVEASSAKTPSSHSVDLEEVHFSYPGTTNEAVNGVSLSVPEGTTVALVGPSGGGKTTLASLIPRFWDATGGSVKIGGVDVCEIPTEELMDTVAFVFQNDQLFKGSLADNVRMGRPDATDEEVTAAIHAAQCDDIVAKLADGPDTLIGTKGIYLSGGECQRVALARAILKDAPIIVLDEATAFADPENEALIQQALVNLAKGKTVFMIAHRLSTVVNADTIVVVDEGRIVETGTHSDLAAKGGLYQRLWNDYAHAAEWKIVGGAKDVA